MLTNLYSKSLAASSFRIMILFVSIVLCNQDAGAGSVHTASHRPCRQCPGTGVKGGVVLGGLEESDCREHMTRGMG